MTIKTARVVPRKRLPAGTELTIKLDSGQVTVVYVVEDLGEIGADGRRLLRVTTERDPVGPDATVFDLPLDLSDFAA